MEERKSVNDQTITGHTQKEFHMGVDGGENGEHATLTTKHTRPMRAGA